MKKRLGIIGFGFLLIVAVFLGREQVKRLYFRVDFQPILLRYAQNRQISPHLVAAVIFAESRFRPDSKSDAGALGLMQLMPETALEMAEKDQLKGFQTEWLLDPEVNIRLGSRYLAELLGTFSNESEALAAYNAGPTVVLGWVERGEGIAFAETRAYVDNVLRYKQSLEELYPDWKKGP